MDEYTALRLSEKIWIKLGKEKCSKRDLIEKFNMGWIEQYYYHCPLCQYVLENSGGFLYATQTGLNCDICPAIWRHYACTDAEYNNWYDAKPENRSYFALLVLDAIQRGIQYYNTLKEMNT